MSRNGLYAVSWPSYYNGSPTLHDLKTAKSVTMLGTIAWGITDDGRALLSDSKLPGYLKLVGFSVFCGTPGDAHHPLSATFSADLLGYYEVRLKIPETLPAARILCLLSDNIVVTDAPIPIAQQ